MRISKKDAKVKELIDTLSTEWNRSLIYQMFSPKEAETICSLPLSKGRADDKMIWRPSHTGQFIVKTTFQLELNRERSKLGESSQADKDNNY